MARIALDSVPGRVVTGAYILHSGLAKLRAPQEQAESLHATATKAYPFLRSLQPGTFVRLLGATEAGIGSALLVPAVPDAVAGVGLVGFASALLTMYARTPAMHEPRSIWPRPAGMAVSKDVWMLGVGLGLIVGAATHRHRAG